MSQYVDTNTKSFVAAGAIPQYGLVELTANPGEVKAHDGTGAIIGSACEAAFAAGDRLSIKLISAAGTHKAIAAAAFALGAPLFVVAGGEVDDAGTVSAGIALQASGADGDIVEILL